MSYPPLPFFFCFIVRRQADRILDPKTLELVEEYKLRMARGSVMMMYKGKAASTDFEKGTLTFEPRDPPVITWRPHRHNKNKKAGPDLTINLDHIKSIFLGKQTQVRIL